MLTVIKASEEERKRPVKKRYYKDTIREMKRKELKCTN
jgi:hypothetical protein